MKLDRQKIHYAILIVLITVIFGIFVARLINIQIVQADDIRERLEVGSTRRQTVKSTRGEIVDRNGKSIVSNTLGYDVVIDKVSFPSSERNEIILRLVELFEQQGAEWNDNLPITRGEPFQFLDGRETEAERLKAHLEVQAWTTAEDTMFHLIERYRLQDYSAEDARRIAGVRYEMERRGFEVNVPYTFANDVDIDLVLKVKERSYQLLGVDVQESARRNYDMGDVAPHLIGRVGQIYAEDLARYTELGYAMDDIVGQTGVEAACEENLRGQNGERLIVMDSNWKVVSAEESTPPVPGNTIVLTLDTDLQVLAQKALEAQINYLQNNTASGQGKEADYGAVVAIKCKTGEILAAATYPSYDQNTYLQDYSALAADKGMPLYNRALMGLYAPGSIFKPVVGTAGLSSGTITEQSTVNCTYIYTRFSDYQPKCMFMHGGINLIRALNVSCNIYFYDVGWNTGIEKIDLTAKQYGLGEPTGIELTENIGQRSNPENFEAMKDEKWSDGNVLQSSIGQLVAQYTPLQLANYAATIGNRGTRMKATIIKEVRDYSRKNVIQPFEPVVVDRVDAQPEHFESIVRGMVSASRTGTARATFGAYPLDVASKTGTPEAEMLNSTFIAFAPAENPEIAVAVVIENGYHGYTGAPVARAIFDEYFGYENPNPLVPKEQPPTDEQRVAEVSGVAPEDTEAQQPEGESSAERPTGDATADTAA